MGVAAAQVANVFGDPGGGTAIQAFDGELLRALVVLKLWQVRDRFVPEAFFEKLRSSKYDWAELQRLLRIADRVEPKPRRPRSSFEQPPGGNRCPRAEMSRDQPR